MSPCWPCGLSCPGGLSLTGLVLQGPQQSEKQKVAQPLAPAYQCQAVTGLTGLTVSKETTRVSQSIRLEQCPKETRTSLESHAGKERVPARGGNWSPRKRFHTVLQLKLIMMGQKWAGPDLDQNSSLLKHLDILHEDPKDGLGGLLDPFVPLPNRITLKTNTSLSCFPPMYSCSFSSIQGLTM